MKPEGQRLAVVGAGIAGLVATYLLQNEYKVTLFEKNHNLGGQINSVLIDRGLDSGLAVDTGFAGFNDRAYPLFNKLLKQLDVAVRPAEFSFSVTSDVTGLAYSNRGLAGYFAQSSCVLRPEFWRLSFDIARFKRLAKRFSAANRPATTVRDFIKDQGLSNSFFENFLGPLCTMIWSVPVEEVSEFSAATILEYLTANGLLFLEPQPKWQAVIGGSHQYSLALRKRISGEVLPKTRIKQVLRSDSGVTIVMESGEQLAFDAVVMATHADEALALLGDASELETACLGVWRYAKNFLVLHSDQDLLPSFKAVRAAANFRRDLADSGGKFASVTYHMNRLQGFKATEEYCVTVNPHRDPSEERVIETFHYTYPIFSPAAVLARERLVGATGTRNTRYCGSYFGYGCLESQVQSAVRVAENFGVKF